MALCARRVPCDQQIGHLETTGLRTEAISSRLDAHRCIHGGVHDGICRSLMSQEYDPLEPDAAPPEQPPLSVPRHQDVEHAPLARAGTTQRAAEAAAEQPATPITDELDALLDAYTQQAQQEVAAAHAAERQRKRPMKAVDKRDAALKAPLPSDNKGYQLLSRMGYIPGQGLGRQRQGPAEPIQLLVKPGKAGLGVDEQRAAAKRAREQEAAAAAIERQQAAKHQQVAFKQRAADAFAARRLRGQLAAAMRCCASLDEGAGLTVADNPLLSWWESQQQDNKHQQEVEGGTEVATSQLALQAERSQVAEVDEDSEQPQVQTAGAAVGLSFDLGTAEGLEQALLAALQHMREAYCYCLYCGCRYSDAEDLNGNCPGLLEQDHDM